MQPTFLEMRLGNFPKRFRKWRREGLLRVLFAMKEVLGAIACRGRLMLVDMAGSENIEQAGQIGFEAKMQTAKINQGNVALKRVVESIANGDSHVPFRDSKLTMLLQDSFEDVKQKN
ncbi:unnamed protein product [Prunus armeniaca]